MPEFPRSDFRLHVGWRTIKTAVTAMLVAMVYCLLDRNPAFACIGVIFGMGMDIPDSIKNGGNRLFGTLIGGSAVHRGVLDLPAFLSAGRPQYAAGGAAGGGYCGADRAVPVLLAGRRAARRRGAALNRILDTAIGVIAAWLVNYFLPRARVVALWKRFKKCIGISKN